MRRFYLNRKTDQTGVSGIGHVLEGVELESGKVVVAWRSPHKTMGIYDSLEQFKTIHVDCHPDSNEVVWLDRNANWHCFACGASGWDQNFCGQCGSPSTGYHPACEGFEPNERHSLEKELDRINEKIRPDLRRVIEIANRLNGDALINHDGFKDSKK